MTRRSMAAAFAAVVAMLALGWQLPAHAQSPGRGVAPATGSTVIGSVQLAAGCSIKAKVWYDSDQYGTWPKGWGEATSCAGPLNLRTQFLCNKRGSVANDTANSQTTKTTSVKTVIRYLGWCSGGTWTAVLSGSYGGSGFYEYFHWKDWGYPV